MDAKKSPLALLAQTCSQIGADSPKLILTADKSKAAKSTETKVKSPLSTSDASLKSSFKPYESVLLREKTQSPEERNSSSASNSNRVRTPVTQKHNSTSASVISSSRCSSNHSGSSPSRVDSPIASERKSPEGGGTQERATPVKHREPTRSPQTPTSSNGKSSSTSSILTSTTDNAVKDLPLGTFKPGTAVPTSSAYLGYAASGIPLPMDLMASSLLSHHQALKSGAYGPYANYARLKGADPLAPACRDPYCTGCSLSSHFLAAKAGSCPAGCTQCDHASKSPPGFLGHNPVAAAAYAHAQLAALAAASQLPYICNWIASDASYCGKRFSSSEELLQHLRNHTSPTSVSEANATLSMLNSTNLPPTHPLLHRTYPTPPLSPLATARYHPYNKPSLLPPSLGSSALAGFPLGHPGLSPYLSPYSLYGPRLSSSSMHP